MIVKILEGFCVQITSLISECLLYFKGSKLHDVTGAGLSKKDDGKLHPVGP